MFRYVHHVKHLIKELNKDPTPHNLHKLEKYLHSSDVAFQQLIHHMGDEANVQVFQGSKEEFHRITADLKREQEIISGLNQRLKQVQGADQFRQWEQLFLQYESQLHTLSKDGESSIHKVVLGAQLKFKALKHHLDVIKDMEHELKHDENRLENAFNQHLLKKGITHPPGIKLRSDRVLHGRL